MVGKNPTQHFLSYDLLESRRIDGKILLPYYIKLIDSMLLRACTVMHHRIHQIVVRKPVTHSSAPRGPHFCSYYKFDANKRNLLLTLYSWVEKVCV